MPLSSFHPITQRWFAERFPAPTEAQRRGWPAIARGSHTLIAAPTGSGKTLAAFLAGIDRLLRDALAGTLRESPRVLYVSPLRALSNDVHRNLEVPLAELCERAQREGHPEPQIRALVRTGDTPPYERQRMLRRPPHILVTTPESLYLLLTGARSREMLRGVETVIVDEIHALARDKRGSHLSLSLARLDALCGRPPTRIGLSATQAPIDEIGRFLVGGPDVPGAGPTIVDAGHLRTVDLRVEVPPRELGTVCTHEQWGEIYERIVSLVREHRSTLIFVNTRKLAERVSHQLSQRLGEGALTSHHGSLSHRHRRRTELGLKDGTLKAVVATASLELGIDVGHIDLVCQLGTPRAIATLLQRVGRAGHSLGAVPKGRLFALTRDDLLECAALVRAARAGRLDAIVIPNAPLDVLAQQIVAAVACDEWDEEELFALCRRAYPYRDLARGEFESVLEILSDGIASRGGRRGAYLHRDRVGRRLRARRGARLVAVTCGGAIPELADYRVVTAGEEKTVVGTLDEDFTIESNGGDIFLLGNTSWRIRHVRGGEVVVDDAKGAPPTVPFWRGEAPGRTPELSAEVSRLRSEIAERADDAAAAAAWLQEQAGTPAWAAEQAVRYVAGQKAATGLVPSGERILFERFFDESGGMQLVVHAPLGTRINRAWGLALRKRFCRTFDFELQASADDDGIVLSLGESHSFPLEQMFRMVPSKLAKEVLVQALLAAPFFGTRWRWNATRALAVKRFDRGRRVPPPLQRMRADDLLTAVFPAQTACLENVVGDIEVPDHPLVNQTLSDCLHEAMDVDGLRDVLERIEEGRIEVVGVDTREPSPFSHERLNANPYAFLDDAPLEERRARAVAMRRSTEIESMRDLARLDPVAIARVREQAWPLVRDADELHDALLSFGALPGTASPQWGALFAELQLAGRATLARGVTAPGLWVATERWPLIRAIWPQATMDPAVSVPSAVDREWDRESAVASIVRGHLEATGPTTADALRAGLGLTAGDVRQALIGLEADGFLLRGRFTAESIEPGSDDETLEWCERRLLARIHRLTLDGLRSQIEPVGPDVFLRFLRRHQGVCAVKTARDRAGLLDVVRQLQGFEAPAAVWERALFPLRMERYDPAWLDALCFSGEVAWGRLRPRRSSSRARPTKSMTRAIPISIFLREDIPWLLPRSSDSDDASDSPAAVRGRPLGGAAEVVYEILERRGALFAAEILDECSLLPPQLDDALGELASAGLLTSDGFEALRSLIGAPVPLPSVAGRLRWRHRARGRGRARSRSRAHRGGGGRWSLLRSVVATEAGARPRVEGWCRLLLERYGVMFRDLLAREPAAPPWYALVRTYRRLEARGEVRGGRFVFGVAGEQYASPRAVTRLRDVGREAPSGRAIVLAATDPLNQFGRAGPGPLVAALPGNLIVVRDGRLAAYAKAGEVTRIEEGALPPLEIGAEHPPRARATERRLVVGRKKW